MQPNLEKNTLKFPSQTVYETVVRQSSSDIIKDAKQWCTLKVPNKYFGDVFEYIGKLIF